MTFQNPEWAILVAVLACLGWQYRSLQLARPLRLLTLLLLVLFLMNPQWQRLSDGLDLWVLVDRSLSAEATLGPKLNEWEGLVTQGIGEHDTLHFVDYASGAAERVSKESRFEDRRTSTNLSVAMQLALARVSTSKAARLLVMTDGNATDSIAFLEPMLKAQGIAVDYRFPAASQLDDFAVQQWVVPSQVQLGEPFLMEAEITGPDAASVTYQLLRNDEPIGEGVAQLKGGRTWLRLKERMPESGAYQYTLELDLAADEKPGNNRYTRWVSITGGPKILLVSRYENAPLRPVFQILGMDVQVVTEPSTLNAGSLDGTRLVIINDIPASAFDAQFLQALNHYIRLQGGACLMLGGQFSFGSGGYFESPIDELIPVSMELKEEHKKLAVAMAIVMDRSGSMSANVGGNLSKMDLANAGVAEAANLLGEADLLTVFAVDSAPHKVIPLTQVGGNRSEIQRRARSIESTGGGIFVYTGMKAAWAELQRARVGQKHILLFADAADAEEPGQMDRLLQTMRKEGATVSVIGLGSNLDKDAGFLYDIATLGEGRIFFNQDASKLPAVFAQETVAVARSSFIEDPVGVEATAGWLEIAATQTQWPETVGGYNLSYLKTGATSAAFTTDAYQAPLVAFWNKQSGRVAAITFPLTGPFSESLNQWAQMGDALQTLTRWLIGDTLPPGLSMRSKLNGNVLEVDLFYDDTWESTLQRRGPRLRYTHDAKELASEATWQRMAPGHYHVSLPLEPEVSYLGGVEVGDQVLPFGPVMAGANTEWLNHTSARQELQQMSRVTGGVERVNLANAWQVPQSQKYSSLRPYLLFALIAVFLTEALVSRLRPA